jgi:hypothetical protein
MKTIWGPWQDTEDGIRSRLRQWWTCDQPTKGANHKAGPEDERCTHCGARRSKLKAYPGIQRPDPLNVRKAP